MFIELSIAVKEVLIAETGFTGQLIATSIADERVMLFATGTFVLALFVSGLAAVRSVFFV